MNPELISNYIDILESKELFSTLYSIEWLDYVKARKELFMSLDEELSYSYGKPEYAKRYVSIPMTPLVKEITDKINKDFNTNYNVVFLNRYDSNSNFINWHSDDSPEMNTNHPICVLSLGQTRRIQTKLKESKIQENEYLLNNGSLFIMPSNFQESYHHRIPKEGFVCSTRISLTFRNYVKP